MRFLTELRIYENGEDYPTETYTSEYLLLERSFALAEAINTAIIAAKSMKRKAKVVVYELFDDGELGPSLYFAIIQNSKIIEENQ